MLLTRLSTCFKLTRPSSLRHLSVMAQLLNKESAASLIQDVDNFLFDCDGVLWDGAGLIEGSLETILKLKSLGKKIFYVTNNSSQTRQYYVKKCERLGFPATVDEIVCTSYIAAEYLKTSNFQGKVYLVGKKESIGAELDNIGVAHTGTGADPIVGDSYDYWLKNVQLDPEVNCVLVGFDPHLSYMKIMKAASYLKNPQCQYLATNEDCSLPVKDSHLTIPGTGTMVKPVTLASGREPILMGKPAPNMFEVLRKVHSLDPKRCMMVGDRLNTDIMFAKGCELKSMLVLSGIQTEEDLKTVGPDESPDYYAPKLGTFGDLLR